MNCYVIYNLGEYQEDPELLKMGAFFERFQLQFIRDRNETQGRMMKIKKIGARYLCIQILRESLKDIRRPD